MHADLVDRPFDPAALLAAFMAGLPAGIGAVASFTGHVRGTDNAGTPLKALHLSGYRTMTQASLTDIAAIGAAQFGVQHGLVVHRIGHLLPGEAIVLVAVAAPHRRAALAAVDCIMDKLKTEAMIWKQEEAEDGARHWIEPTADDHEACARWNAA